MDFVSQAVIFIAYEDILMRLCLFLHFNQIIYCCVPHSSKNLASSLARALRAFGKRIISNATYNIAILYNANLMVRLDEKNEMITPIRS
jgi:hypothetical protein